MSTQYDITADMSKIDFFPGSTLGEILQNVRTIINTIKGTVPLDRDFGMDPGLIDMPINLMRTKLTTAIIETVEKYEPRVKVTEVDFDGTVKEGIVFPTVKVVIK